MIETIATALITHLGKKVIDSFWERLQSGKAPIANKKGVIGKTSTHAGRTFIKKEYTIPNQPYYELVIGEFFMNAFSKELLLGTEVPLVLIIEETEQEVFLFEADLDTGYEIELAPGIYSFYTLLVDRDNLNLYTSEIYAIGLPSNIEITEIELLELEDEEDFWDIVEDTPREINQEEGPYLLDFVLIDTDDLPDFPKILSQLVGGQVDGQNQTELTGTWKLKEEYEFGQTNAYAYLAQIGSTLTGLINIRDIAQDGNELIIQEVVTGQIDGNKIRLQGKSVKVIKGHFVEYELDQWKGTIQSNKLITGYSQDAAGITGEFSMERVNPEN